MTRSSSKSSRQTAGQRKRTPTGRSSQRHATPKSLDTHRKIVEAAIDCFVEVGYHRTNMSRIAERAGVTRGCMQYYFSSTEHVLRAAADHLSQTLWGGHFREVTRWANEAASLEHALDHFFNLRNDRYYVAWMELVAAARTEPSLRPLVRKGYEAAEDVRQQASRVLFTDEADHDNPEYVAVADLVRLVTEALTLSVFTYAAEERTENVIAAVKAEAYALWRLAQRGEGETEKPKSPPRQKKRPGASA
ncbi:MAG: TetR/AcrR family transcriptional regulator [Pseudomonadota bacterium]